MVVEVRRLEGVASLSKSRHGTWTGQDRLSMNYEYSNGERVLRFLR